MTANTTMQKAVESAHANANSLGRIAHEALILRDNALHTLTAAIEQEGVGSERSQSAFEAWKQAAAAETSAHESWVVAEIAAASLENAANR